MPARVELHQRRLHAPLVRPVLLRRLLSERRVSNGNAAFGVRPAGQHLRELSCGRDLLQRVLSVRRRRGSRAGASPADGLELHRGLPMRALRQRPVHHGVAGRLLLVAVRHRRELSALPDVSRHVPARGCVPRQRRKRLVLRALVSVARHGAVDLPHGLRLRVHHREHDRGLLPARLPHLGLPQRRHLQHGHRVLPVTASSNARLRSTSAGLDAAARAVSTLMTPALTSSDRCCSKDCMPSLRPFSMRS